MVGVAMLVGLIVSSGTAGAGVAGQTKTLLTNTNRGCHGEIFGLPTQTFGSATMNQSKAPKNGSSNLSAGLTIRGAAWTAIYNMRLVQFDSNGNAIGDSCQTIVGTVTTDAFGNATGIGCARAARCDTMVGGPQQPGR